MSLFGPLFRYELTRLARRGLQPRLRAVFAGLLLITLFLAYLSAFPSVSPYRLLTNIDQPLSIAAASRFGNQLVIAVLFTQAAVVALVTPVIAAGAIGEEKNRRSLDLLLTTSLTNTEIVVGMLAARMVFVGSLLLTGLPTFTLVMFFGGIDIGQLVAGYGVALLTMLSYGAFSLYQSVVTKTLGTAVFRAYAWVIAATVAGLVLRMFVFPAFLSPFSTLLMMFEREHTFADPWAILGVTAVLHLYITAQCLQSAAERLRDVEPNLRTVQPTETPRKRRPSRFSYRRTRPLTVPPVDDANPLRWKEHYFGGWQPPLPTQEMFLLVMAVSPFLIAILANIFTRIEDARRVFAAIVVLVAMSGVLGVGLRAVEFIIGERRRGMLEALLCLPGERSEIVTAKVEAAIPLAAWPAALSGGFVLFVCLLRTGFPFPAAVALPVVLCGWVVCAIGFGLWLSVRCVTRERAIAWFFGLGITAGILLPMFAALVDQWPNNPATMLLASVLRGLGVFTGFWNTTPILWNQELDRADLFDCYGAMLGAAIAAAVGVVFGRVAVRALEQNEC